MRAVAILCAVLMAMPIWAGTWRDDFEDGQLAGYEELLWDVGATDWYIENGELVSEVRGNNAAYQTLEGIIVEDATIELDGMIEEPDGPYVTIEFAMHIADRHTFTNLSFGHWGAAFRVGGGLWWNKKEQGWQHQGFALSYGQWYHLKGVVEGSRYSLYVDDKQVFAYTQDRLESGRIGFGGGGCQARLDNLVITGEGVPDSGPSGWPVEPEGRLAAVWGGLKGF